MSIISSLNIAQQALSVNQAAITVVSNNIANVDNEYYSKLSVDLSEVINYTPSTNSGVSVANSLSGVQLSSIVRSTDTYLQGYYRQENTAYSYLAQYSSIATDIESLTNELNDTGLSEALTTFYEAVDGLSDDATDITARQNYASAAENVCYVFNNIYKDVSNIQQSLVGDYTVAGSVESSEITSQTDEVNALLDQLASINSSLIKTGSKTGSDASSILDKRDQILDSLSALIPIDYSENLNGTVNVSINEYELVNGMTVVGHLGTATGTATEPAVINLVDPDDGSIIKANINSAIDGGSIGAILDFCSSATSSNFTINSVLSQINTLASTFAAVMNTIQIGDPQGDGSTAVCLTDDGSELQKATENIFTSASANSTSSSTTRDTEDGDVAGTVIATSTDSAGNATTTVTTTTIDSTTNKTTINQTVTTGISAGDIAINSDISDNPYLIAAGRLTAEEYADFDKYKTSIGNSDNATLMLNSRTTKYAGIGNLTLEGYLTKTVTQVGSSVKSIDSDLDNQQSVLDSIESKLNSATGVNLDEELIDLIKYQRAYQAAARIFSVCNELLEGLMTLGQ